MIHPEEVERLRGVNVYLIGMMGSGKSTVGSELAAQLRFQFFDTDGLVEQVGVLPSLRSSPSMGKPTSGIWRRRCWPS